MSPELKKFIKDNKNLINENTKESWEEIYAKSSPDDIGLITDVALSMGINPVNILGYMPPKIFSGSTIQFFKIPEGITSIPFRAFSDCVSLNNVIIPESVKTVGGWAFSGCNSLTSIKLPNSLIFMEDGAFVACRNLQSVIIPDNVISIGWQCFEYCYNLKEVILGKNVREIHRSAFSNCPELQSIIFKGEIADWKKIKKGKKWDWVGNSPIQKIICTDGVIEL